MPDDAVSNAQPRSAPRQTLPRSARVRSRVEFDRVFQGRNRASDALLTVYMAAEGRRPARLGIAASKRLGNAVVRNRVKRLVREAFRRLRADLPDGTDWVVVPRQGNPSLDELGSSLRQLVGKLLVRRDQANGRSPS